MFWVLCEGSKDKSEYKFVERILEEFSEGVPYTQIAANGNYNLRQRFAEIAERANKGDCIVVFLDSVPMIGKESLKQVLSYFKILSKEKEILLKYTNYFCFEEIFLSYKGIFSLVPLSKEEKEALVWLQSEICNGSNWFADNKDKLYVWKSRLSSSFNNLIRGTREHFSAALCSTLLSRAKGSFRLTKSFIGDCWIRNCEDVNKTKMGNGVVCKSQCTYCCKNCSFKEKLDDLESRSVSGIGSPLSSIFN